MSAEREDYAGKVVVSYIIQSLTTTRWSLDINVDLRIEVILLKISDLEFI